MSYGRHPEFDDKDGEIRAKCLAAFDTVQGPRCGDYIEFSCGTVRRVSYVWDWGDGPEGVQTSAGGSWFLGEGYCSFSGSLYRSVKPETLTLTEEKRDGKVWFFHHGYQQADNGVYTAIPFRVFRCSEVAPD